MWGHSEKVAASQGEKSHQKHQPYWYRDIGFSGLELWKN